MNKHFTDIYINSIYDGNAAPFDTLDQNVIDACRKYSAVEMRIILGQEKYYATPDQIEAGLTDAHERVRAVYAERNDFVPTSEQIQRGLEDVDKNVKEIWMQRVTELSASLLDDSTEDNALFSI